MFRYFSRPIPLVLLLAFLTVIPVLTSLTEVFQIPTGTYPADSARLAVAPVAWFAHVLAGVAFGITGPLQFVRALRHRFGRLHRIAGRIFVVAGAALGLSGLSLLAQVTSVRTPVADIARGLFGLALLVALALAMAAIRDRDIQRHRAWMIRSYAVGMGLGVVGLVFFPIYLVTGAPPTGLGADMLFVASWLVSIFAGEVVILRLSTATNRRPA
ncbi:DUF2306 domain-containing protein [Tabrizicola thermarum]|uniref:DUF2306 domain-containing protein n=1 Tax=Tabrizicola thermarum TaxID=2670345 RepID=UPI0011EA91C9|nr:DUF2306 domain-containing protein [Tabrizicola thermarum]